MLYHYFGRKTLPFVAVLEEALSALRQRALQIDVAHRDPREGLLQLFDFTAYRFEYNQHLVRLLSAEKLFKTKYMRKSSRIPEMKLPMLLPGITVSTSASVFAPIKQMQLQRFDGTTWKLFGEVIPGTGS